MRSEALFITGMGAVSAAGEDVPGTLASFARGSGGPGPVTLFETELDCPAFEATGVTIADPDREMRALALVMKATDEAIAEARLDGDLTSRRVGICIGTTTASQLNDLDYYQGLRNSGTGRIELLDRYLRGNLAEAVGRRLAMSAGPRATVANACSSGADAIGVALVWLRAGLCDVAIAGGADELNRVPLCGFNSLSIMSPEPCRPFDRDRDGMNLGEGAGILVLETESSMRARGMQTPLLLSGFGSATDAYHMTAPRPDGTGLEAATRTALSEAGVDPADVGFVNAHGTATADNDRSEGLALERIFGKDVVVLSTKGLTGHTLAAAGGLEAVFAAACLRVGWVPASAGFSTPDPEIPITPVRERTTVRRTYAVSTSLAFGGSNAAVVVSWVPSHDKEPAE